MDMPDIGTLERPAKATDLMDVSRELEDLLVTCGLTPGGFEEIEGHLGMRDSLQLLYSVKGQATLNTRYNHVRELLVHLLPETPSEVALAIVSTFLVKWKLLLPEHPRTAARRLARRRTDGGGSSTASTGDDSCSRSGRTGHCTYLPGQFKPEFDAVHKQVKEQTGWTEEFDPYNMLDTIAPGQGVSTAVRDTWLAMLAACFVYPRTALCVSAAPVRMFTVA